MSLRTSIHQQKEQEQHRYVKFWMRRTKKTHTEVKIVISVSNCCALLFHAIQIGISKSIVVIMDTQRANGDSTTVSDSVCRIRTPFMLDNLHAGTAYLLQYIFHSNLLIFFVECYQIGMIFIRYSWCHKKY